MTGDAATWKGLPPGSLASWTRFIEPLHEARRPKLNRWIDHLLVFAGSHPHLLGLIVFASAAAEAVTFVGTLFPGAAIIIAVSGLAGAVDAPVWHLVLWAIVGAAASDGLSYWIGRHYGSALASRWPFRVRPQILERGSAFFQFHGGKSVFIGRFVIGVKAVVPLVAGMIGMPAARFLTANVSAAIVWALVHVIPAAFAGVLLMTIGAVSGRLLAALVGSFVAIAVALWLAWLLVARAAPWLAGGYRSAVERLLRSRNGVLRRIAQAADPHNHRLLGAAGWSTLFALAAVAFLGVVEDLLNREPLVRADAAISQFIRSVRIPPLDRLMIGITEFGDPIVVIASIVTLLGALALARRWRLALVVAGAFGFASAMVPLIKLVLHRQRPIDIYSGAGLFAFPSGHSTFSTLLFATFALLAAPHLHRRGQIAVWTAALLGVVAVGTSRIYLGAHWPSDVIGGVLLGVLIGCPLALLLAYKTHAGRAGLWSGVAAAVVFLGFGAVHGYLARPGDMVRYAAPTVPTVIAKQDWLASGWAALPTLRIDLFGETEEPLFLQYTGTPPKVANLLANDGWQAPEDGSAKAFLKLLSPVTTLHSLPPWPLLHDGGWPVLTLVKATTDADQRLVFRLWPSTYVVKTASGEAPLLLGSLARERVAHPYEALTVMFDEPATASAAQAIVESLKGASGFTVELRSRPSGMDAILVSAAPGANAALPDPPNQALR
jgi:membrane protein DedA with SNARE-associated domain/membrane-associated phospholipid phosphatase